MYIHSNNNIIITACMVLLIVAVHCAGVVIFLRWLDLSGIHSKPVGVKV